MVVMAKLQNLQAKPTELVLIDELLKQSKLNYEFSRNLFHADLNF